MSQTDLETLPPPLTVLAEDEILFRDSVRQFAETSVRPLVREMDEEGKIPRTLIDQLFELGVMGIEIPEAYGGGGGRFFHSVMAVEALSRVDPSIGVLVDVQNTLVINALLRWASDDIKRRYLPRLASAQVGAYALSEAGSGSDAFALTTRAAASGSRVAARDRLPDDLRGRHRRVAVARHVGLAHFGDDTKFELAWSVQRSQWGNGANFAAVSGGGLNAGMASGLPAFEARARLFSKAFDIWLSGHWQTVDRNGAGVVAQPNTYTDYVTTLGTVGLKLNMGPVAFAGSAWYGKNAGPLLGNIVQFAPLTYQGDIFGYGAWGQVGMNISKALSLWYTYGLDHPLYDNIFASGLTRMRNQNMVGMVRWQEGAFIGLDPCKATLRTSIARATRPSVRATGRTPSGRGPLLPFVWVAAIVLAPHPLAPEGSLR